MYDPIFAKSFSRYDRRRFGCFALILSLIVTLSITSTFKPSLHPLTIIGDAVSLHLSINTLQELLIDDDVTYNSAQTAVSDHTNPQTSSSDAAPTPSKLVISEPNPNVDELQLPQSHQTNNAEPPEASNHEPKPELAQKIHQKQNIQQPLCRVLKADADYCEFEGDVRVDSNSSTVFLITPSNSTNSWSIQPYPRKGIAFVKHWTVRLAAEDAVVPKCDQNHHLPALLFSMGGFTGNHFHDFADLLVPLFTTSFQFKKEVHFLAADYKQWWPAKYRPLLDQLTRHHMLDTDRETNVHCYHKIILGLKFHRELVVDSAAGVSMHQFRQLLRRTYSLDRKKAVSTNKPRLMIVSRKRSRILTNEDQVSRQARKLGYEVVSAEGDVSANLTKFAQLVNSCDVMMGVHGAGLTNMVFLPENAVLIQIVPLGAIDIFAKLDFGNPSAGMNIRYLEYKIEMKESSLVRDYSIDDRVLKDPLSIHREGWAKLRDVYLNNQNVTVDVHRFRATLAKALKLLRRR
ncbi:hypothetical protein C2S52_021773 [Perilla frutescens var. hirtella]|nr:hypothetical protein C2S52_021773 [Perilla frutescens var. hirtella]KAH6807678.1 hypothetical protein C2S51_028786 [Perilla frutescens var. frutescens]